MNHWEEENSVFLAKWANNELTDQERSEFENSEEGKTFLKLIKATDNLQLSPLNVDQAFEEFKPRHFTKHQKPTKVFRLSPVVRMAIAASVLAIFTITYLITRPDYTVVTTGFGESQAVTLPGGSVITLNANSSIKYEADEWEEGRNVELEGEAFFDVVKGNDFVVHTDEGNIKVLGTSFNIRTRDDDLDVVCYTGKVNVSDNNYSVDLTPGNLVRVHDGKVLREWTKTLTQQPLWISGTIEFDNASLTTVLEELKNQFNINYEYDQNLAIDGFVGAFSITNMENAVQTVMTAMDIRYTFDAGQKRLVILGMN